MGSSQWAGIAEVKILVVDDEPDQRYLLRRIFERAGHKVVEAAHGAAAMESVWQTPPNLVVTDLMMPVMDGAELIRRLRADPLTATIPILAITADGALVDGIPSGGADANLTKPYRAALLMAVADALTAQTSQRT